MNTSSEIFERRERSSLRRLRDADGITLVEVLVSALMVGLIGLTLVGIDAAGQTSADQRRRAQAAQVAEQDQERIKGLSADQIAKLDETNTVTVDGVDYSVHSTGQFISSSSSAASCSSSGAAADYAKVVSDVDWASNARPDVIEQSIISPRAGGGVLADVNDQTGAALPGASVSLSGTDQDTGSVRRRGTADVDGCVIFGALLVGDYSVTASKSGYVDPQGSTAPSNAITATAGNTSTSPFSLGLAGKITASFATFITTGTQTNNQKAPSMSWNNTGMLTAGSSTPSAPAASIVTPTNLYPFTVSTNSYTNNYSVWAGTCASDLPPTASQRFATVGPGASATSTVLMPAMAILTTLKTSSSSNVRSVPDHVVLTDSCGQSWSLSGTNLNTATGTTSSAGVLAFPGQPYSSSYTVCVDDKSGTTSYKASTTMTNTNFAAATSKTITVDATATANKGTC